MFGLSAETSNAQNWAAWRGVDHHGFSNADPPITWSSTENVRWRRELPGEGKSTPILWGKQLFVVVAIPIRDRKPDESGKPSQIDHDWCVLSFDRHNGKELWRRALARAIPHEPGHPTNSLASGSPVTDGKRIFVSLGSRGVYSLDLHGNLLWKRQLGMMQTRFGFGEASTPALHQNTLIVPWDHEGQSSLFALDAESGQTKWSIARDEPTCWSTPLIVTPTDSLEITPQVILNGKRIISYRLSDGKPLWSHHHEGVNPIACPIRYRDLAVLMLGYRGYSIQAIDLLKTLSTSEHHSYSFQDSDDAVSTQSDRSEQRLTHQAAVRWSRDDTGPYVSSAAVCEQKLFVTKGLQGILSVFQADTGEVLLDQKRIDDLGTLYASPLAVSGKVAPRLYYCSREGKTVVISAESPFKILAVNQLEDPIDASPVAAQEQLFIRTTKHLFCLERISSATD